MQHDYPDFFALAGSKPVTFRGIEQSEDELQIVAFTVERIEWLKPINSSSKKVDATGVESGKAKIKIIDSIYSEGQRIKNGEDLWLSGYRSSHRNTYLISEAGKPSSGSGDVILWPDNKTAYLALLKRRESGNLWEAVRIQEDVENAWSGGKSLAGFRDQLRATAEGTIRNRRIHPK